MLERGKKESYLNLALIYFLMFKKLNRKEDDEAAWKYFTAAEELGENVSYQMMARS